MNILAVIPARGGSKRLPRKNIRVLAGQPLVAWTIQAARRSGVFSDVLVSTDNAEIADISRREDNGRVVYEVEFTDKGKNPTMKVAEDGTLVQDLQK